MTSSTKNKKLTALPAKLDVAAIGHDAINLYFNWLSLRERTFNALERPWVPVGCVGPILVLAHEAVNDSAYTPVPSYLAQHLLVSSADYEKALAFVSAKIVDGMMVSFDAPKNVAPQDRPSLLSNEAAVEFILDSLLLRQADRNTLAALRTRIHSGPFPNETPEGVPEACVFLQRPDYPVIDPRSVTFNEQLSAFIPKSSANTNNVAGLSLDDGNIAYFVSSKFRNELVDGIASQRKCPRREVKLVIAPAGLLMAAIQDREAKLARAEFQKTDTAVAGANTDYSKQHIQLDEGALKNAKLDDSTQDVEKLFHLILYKAIRAGASDIHFEQVKGRGQIRIRVDGQLRVLHAVSPDISKGLIGVVKSGIIHGFTTNSFDAQDASSSVRLGSQVINIRASLTPHSKNGYQVLVVRLLPKQTSLRSLDGLGIAESELKIIRRAISRPSGLIIVTGPTGSGKTTTLYSCLGEINVPTLRITTMEDPVEIELDGATQSAVDEARGVTFGNLLRAALRQDPDIILVGEVRDTETARLCLQAASTGHLVFTTLHANSETEAVTRMMDLIDDPKMLPVLAKSLLLLQSQRLVRSLCKKCRTEEKTIPSEVSSLFEKHKITCKRYYRPNPDGCQECYEGYAGRTAIMSLLPITKEIATRIAKNENAFELRDAADKAGFSSLYHEALECVAEGMTSIEEASDWEDPWATFSQP